jgi:hypothetical protein
MVSPSHEWKPTLYPYHIIPCRRQKGKQSGAAGEAAAAGFDLSAATFYT